MKSKNGFVVTRTIHDKTLPDASLLLKRWNLVPGTVPG